MKEFDELVRGVESVSKGYAEKFGITRDGPWFVLKLQEELGELVQAYLMMTGAARTKDRSPEEMAQAFRRELADVFCHVLLLAEAHDVDVLAEVRDKWLVWADRDEERISPGQVPHSELPSWRPILES